MSILDTIVEEKHREITALPQRALTAAELEALSRADGGRRDFLGALRGAKRVSPAARVALIAEIKKASPSAGVIRADFDPVRLARDYEAAGATCLSVLTDRKFFQGSLAFLKEIRQAVKLPLLRKDFIIDERQIAESLQWGADAILLIVAILTDEQLTRFQALAAAAHLTVLVEVHDEPELERAVACGARLIGVNNRDLKTFKVDLGTTERLAVRLFSSGTPAGREGAERLLVAESGIHTPADVARVARAGAGAILVGESLMRERELGPKVRELLGLS
ncbi:MAG TPA: indole-3-glycerol phosphate synthase TrpC [Verrucomicrobiae bacterium]|nr:indole-3-glycerol phosphate synthase TrpC [Verrucomicrobiae bacterium]